MEQQIHDGDHSYLGEKTDSPSSRHKARIILCIPYVAIFAVASVMTLPLIIMHLPSPSENAIEKVIDWEFPHIKLSARRSYIILIMSSS